MYKDDKDWWDTLGGKAVSDVDPKTDVEANVLRDALHTWKEEPNLPPLRLPTIVKLNKWVQESIEGLVDGWCLKEEVFEFIPAHSNCKNNTIGRAKLFELNGKKIVLLVNLLEKDKKIMIHVYSSKTTKCLPKGLVAIVLDSLGNIKNNHIEEVKHTNINSIKLPDIPYDLGKTFSVKLHLEDTNIVEYFEI